MGMVQQFVQNAEHFGRYWRLIVELWVAFSFSCAFAWGWKGMESITECPEQDARDEAANETLAPECAPTINAKGQRR